MKNILLIISLLLIISCGNNKQRVPIQKETNVLPKNMIYVKYNQIVEGYEVSVILMKRGTYKNLGRYSPHWNYPAIIHLKKDSVNIYIATEGFSDSAFETKDFYSDSATTYNLDYREPLDCMILSPFIFKDVDFDGEKEFLINDWTDMVLSDRGGSYYKVYKIDDERESAYIVNEYPFNELNDCDSIDYKTKSIIRYIGKPSNSAVYIVKQDSVRITFRPKAPETLGNIGEVIYDEIYDNPNSSFKVVEFIEKSSFNLDASRKKYYYSRSGNHVRLIKTENINE